VHKHNNKNGGGDVAILINNKINFVSLNIFDHLDIEVLCFKNKYKQMELLYIAYYNPPSKELSK
jgi:hypothetical protein